MAPLTAYAIDVSRDACAFRERSEGSVERPTESPLRYDFDGGLGGGSGEEAARRQRLKGDH
jgi:hypothetical protein